MKAKHKAKKTNAAGPGKDKMHFTAGEVILDLPEVKDIPGQEHIRVPPLGELADITISSDDEEGKGIFDSAGDELAEGDVTPEEKKALKDAAEKTPGARDEDSLQAATLDQRDEDGAPLNEKTNLSGSELDVPGSEDDDDDEKIGEEDEENNDYSLDGEDEDDSISK
ncbi:MAG: hypothetical protein J0H29_16840 [Sphingobacteriales bacterium]|nr:hypothetical protein [Sphingobacteriales bacterium]OJY86151.1 MAG: hypothetical protein BGP14_16875 [Sphingobacteriales bacterium 44-15]